MSEVDFSPRRILAGLFRHREAISSSMVSRRGFLKIGALAAFSCAVPVKVFGVAGPFPSGKRTLSFYNLHTSESLETVYWSGGKYLRPALSRIDHLFRDHRTGEVKRIDVALLDLLSSLRASLCTDEPFQIISGYRSPGTNATLHRKSRGVASRSLHMEGKAVDISLPETSLSTLHRKAVTLGMGGVGYYPDSGFVHVDVGRVRYW